MIYAILHLNYLAVVVAVIAGYAFGWTWYSPALFGKAWMDETKFTQRVIEANTGRSIFVLFLRSFLHLVTSTFGLAVLIKLHGITDWLGGMQYGVFVGGLVVGVRLLNGGMWEQRSFKLQCITVGHEAVLFALQGALLAVWN